MAGLTTYAQQKMLDHIVGKTAFPMPTVWVALFTTAPSDAGGGTEANYTGYARAATAAADWNAASGTTITTANAVAFPPCTAGANTITHFALMDAATGGNMLGWSTCSLEVSAGITPQFDPGDLACSLD